MRQSGAALATVVGVLIEVPVMLAVANIVNRSRAWYETRPGVLSYEQCCPATGIHPPGV
jgi:ACR3 family arsenite transporter